MSSDDMIRIWNIRTKCIVCCFAGHLHQVLDGVFLFLYYRIFIV